MTGSRVVAKTVNFNKTTGTTLVSQYGTVNGLYTNLEHDNNGFQSDTSGVAGWDLFDAGATSDLDRGEVGPHQYAQITIKSVATTGVVGVALRVSDPIGDGYVVYLAPPSANLWVVRYDAGIPSLVAFGAATPMVNDTISGEYYKDTITAYHNGVLKVTGTDSTYSDGEVGPYASLKPAAGTAAGDSFECGWVALPVPHQAKRPSRLSMIQEAQRNKLKDQVFEYLKG